MAKQASRIVRDAWRDSGEFSFSEVHERTQAYWLRILTAYKEMSAVCRLLQRQETLWPDQCGKIIKAIETVTRSMSEFQIFLSQSAHLPFTVCNARYSLIKALGCVDIQFKELQGLVTRCRVANKSFSSETSLQGIRQKLNEIQVSWSNVRRGIRILLQLTRMSPERYQIEEKEKKIIVFAHRRASLQKKRAQRGIR